MIRQAAAKVAGRVRHFETGAKATYADGHVGDLLTTKNVTFTSRDTSTATVSGNTLTWRHGGTILVTATVNGFTSAAVSISAAYAPESIKVTDDSGKPIDNITLRVGEEKYLKVRVLPTEASQGFTAVAANPTVASVGAPTPKTITVTPDNPTLRSANPSRCKCPSAQTEPRRSTRQISRTRPSQPSSSNH